MDPPCRPRLRAAGQPTLAVASALACQPWLTRSLASVSEGWLASRSSRSERRLERETGFEPATSTLARSHSTTELFPPEPSPYHHNRTERKTLAASSGGVGLM